MNGGMVMSSYKEYRKKALQHPQIKKEYDTKGSISNNRDYSGRYK